MRALQDRTRAQRWAEGALAPHPHRIELRGSLQRISWPEICAHCGMPASGRIVVRKAFRPLPRRHSSAGLRSYRISTASIPFCASCISSHQATVQRPPFVKKALTLVFHPLIIPVVGFTWLATIFVREYRTAPIPDLGWFPGWGVPLVLAAALAWCVFVLWRATAPGRLDPQTAITRSCDFSEDVSGFLEQERRIYSLSNQSFASRMTGMNASRVWTAGDQSRSMNMQLVFAAAALVALAAIAGYVKLMGP